MSSDETIPDVIDRLVAFSGGLTGNDPPVWELSSERVVTCSDHFERATVTVADYEIRSVQISPAFFITAELSEVEECVAEAATAALKQFLKEEMDEAASAALPMGEVHSELMKLSKDVTAAFDRHMDVLDGRARQL